MKQIHKTNTDYKYKGITIHTARGLHEFAIELILRYSHGKNGHVLDLGCGSGAFTRRLQDHGFTTTSVDLALDTFLLDSEAHELDLNKDFASRLNHRRYDIIIALEVIEHLENPLHFLRQLRILATTKTQIFISFPNIYLHYAIRSFFKNGTFINWNAAQYWDTGHQTIMTDWLFEQHLKKTGFSVKEKHFCAPLAFPKNLKSYILNKIFYLLVCFLNPKISHSARLTDTILYLIKKTGLNH